MSEGIIARGRELKTMVANAQRSHAKDWLDDHGYKFRWHQEKNELVLVQPAPHNAGVLLRPDEVLTPGQYRELQDYVRIKMREDRKQRQIRKLEGAYPNASR